jgi:ABC-type multidrug transport system ATPase subunit
MGPSGAGKSSFLSILTSRIKSTNKEYKSTGKVNNP